MYGFPENKRYNTAVGRYRRIYGERLQKLVIDAGFTCPNRDGTKGRGGCTFCDNSAFHPGYSVKNKSIFRQIDEGIEFHRVRYKNTKHYLAYFQSFSNTYAPTERLMELYETALSHPDVVGIVIGTRPDCVDDEKLDYLASLKEKKMTAPGKENFPNPLISVEYGIESCYDATLERINRGHDFETARKAVEMTAERGIDVGAHFILGLPGETYEMFIEQCDIINSLKILSVKFHQLQIVKGTKIEKEYYECPSDFVRFSLDDYLNMVIDIMERLRPDLCIERVAGEVPPGFVRETPWGLIRNFQILQKLDEMLESRDTYQGRLLKKY